MIHAEKANFAVARMAELLDVSRSGYYAWRTTEPSQRSKDDTALIAVMRYLHARARGNPGVRRLWADLVSAGYRVSKKRVWRLMRAAGLRGRHPRAWKRTTVGGDHPVPAPDLIGRAFFAERPDEKWCGDITYVKTWDGWAYVATVIDLHSRKIVGYAIADHMRTELVTAALDMALVNRRPTGRVIFHSDRGAQYTSSDFAKYCKKNNIRRSLGRTGICYDNAVSESTFASYKKELIHTRPWPDLKTLAAATADWIDNYFNTIRRHSYLGYLTPHEYELGFREITQLAA